MQWYQTHVKVTYIWYCGLLGIAGVGWTLMNATKLIFWKVLHNKKKLKKFFFVFGLYSLLPCRTLPWDKWKKCTTSLHSWPYWWPYWVCFFLHLTSYNNILCICCPMVLTNAVVSNTCEGYVHLVLWFAWHCRRGVDGPLWMPKNWFFERFYIIKSNWKSSSLFLVFILSCLLMPDPSLGQMKNALPVCIRDLIGDLTGSVSFCT